MPIPPDWSQLGGKSRAWDGLGEDFTPLGDPARWGAEVTQLLRGNGVLPSQQILRVQCADNYPRNWQIVGTLSAPPAVWEFLTDFWEPALHVAMGVGQTTVTHRLDLRGLCALALTSGVYFASVQGGLETRPFVISGGLIGQALAATLVTTLNFTEVEGENECRCAILCSPYAAGTGL
jgi:hypothetical protein